MTPVASGWDDYRAPIRSGVTRVVLDCRHRILVGARHRLLLYADGTYAPVFCHRCCEDRLVEMVVWKAAPR
jgi:hypothetical protein